MWVMEKKIGRETWDVGYIVDGQFKSIFYGENQDGAIDAVNRLNGGLGIRRFSDMQEILEDTAAALEAIARILKES